MIRAIAIAALLALGGCQTGAGGASVPVQTYVDQAAVALTLAERAALRYAQLPRCPKASLCSDAATVAEIKLKDQSAYAAVKAARQAGDKADTAALNAAIAALAAAIPAADTTEGL